jgi:uroporphyrinogen decarboxylase
MNSRERVLAALNHQEPDRAPVDLAGHRSSGIAALAYARLRDYLGLPSRPIRIYDMSQQLAIVDDDVLDLFGGDTVELGRGFALEPEHWADWVLPDGTPCQIPAWIRPERQDDRWVIRSPEGCVTFDMPDGSLYFEQVYWPFADGEPDHTAIAGALDRLRLSSPPGPLASGPQKHQVLAEGARALRATTNRAILGLFGGNLMELGHSLYRNDNFYLLLAAEPGRAHDFLEKATEMHLANLEEYLGAVGPYIDIIQFGDDLGMQSGPQISPEMYREFFKPRHARMWRRAKELAPVKVMLHCCGGIRELLPDLIDAGLDALNPVQINCAGMEARGLKADFGGAITLWGGGCDTQHVLPDGTPDEVRRHVQAQVRTLQPDGGFVFQQVHNILADVPAQNIVAMYEAVHLLN